MPSTGWAWDSEAERAGWRAQPRTEGMEREIETKKKGKLEQFELEYNEVLNLANTDHINFAEEQNWAIIQNCYSSLIIS